MFEKVNPKHPDKVADRIAGAIVDLAYKKDANPKIACEILMGHGKCNIISETSVSFSDEEIKEIVNRICEEEVEIEYIEVKQDEILAHSQEIALRSGDNGIFKGVPVTDEEKKLCKIAHEIYKNCPSDGKYILNGNHLIVCQSNATNEEILKIVEPYNLEVTVNPLGEWTGGINVDSGATNRKLGSDMGGAMTGGGLHGKDYSKADVSVNIYAYLKAQELGKPVELYCAIGDDMIDGKPYTEIVEIAKEFIASRGGFEKFAEWGLI